MTPRHVGLSVGEAWTPSLQNSQLCDRDKVSNHPMVTIEEGRPSNVFECKKSAVICNLILSRILR